MWLNGRWLVKNDLERLWKEAVVAKYEVLLCIYIEELKKTTKNFGVVSVQVKIWIGHMQNSGQKNYWLNQLAPSKIWWERIKGSLILSQTQEKDRTHRQAN
jgi:hypothetical protein